MTRARTTLSVTVLLAIGIVGGAGPVHSTAASAGQAQADYEITDPVRIALWNETDNRQPVEILDWTVDRYTLAGLQLPDSEIYFHPFHPSLDDCAGHGGYHEVVDGGHRIDICAVGVPSRRRMLLHEFAHAWARHNVTERQRETFLAKRGLESWNDHDTEWAQRGTEHVAEIITWGLDERCNPRELIGEEHPVELAAAFTFLTGTQPLCQLMDDGLTAGASGEWTILGSNQ